MGFASIWPLADGTDLAEVIRSWSRFLRTWRARQAGKPDLRLADDVGEDGDQGWVEMAAGFHFQDGEGGVGGEGGAVGADAGEGVEAVRKINREEGARSVVREK